MARTLRLDRAEREHLYRLAEATPLRAECARPVIPDAIQEIVHSLEPLPASLINSRFDFLMSNNASEELFWEWYHDALHPQEHAVVLHHRAERPR